MSPARGADLDTEFVAHKRVDRLRRLATENEHEAADQSWAWIVEAGRRILDNRDEARTELDAMFHLGVPAVSADGPMRGTLISFVVHPIVDRLMATLTTAWLPWVGIKFDRTNGTGVNLLRASARLPSKLLWPLYRMGSFAGMAVAFAFDTRVTKGAVDPRLDVLALDYGAGGPEERNPWLLVQSIRADIVELVPGVYLGKMLWHKPRSGYLPLAYFALRTPVSRSMARPRP